MSSPLNPARHEGESFEDYKKRRALCNRAIKHHLRGKLTPVLSKQDRLMQAFHKLNTGREA